MASRFLVINSEKIVYYSILSSPFIKRLNTVSFFWQGENSLNKLNPIRLTANGVVKFDTLYISLLFIFVWVRTTLCEHLLSISD